MYILGINAYHGDAAAALIKNGRIVAAVEEERFNRIKHCAGFPTESVKYCLQAAGIEIAAVEHVGISRDPSAHLHKKVLFAATRAARELVGSRQKAVGSEQNIATIAEEDTGRMPARHRGSTENGNGRGVFRQVADRLQNAARICDLKDELRQTLGASPANLRAQFHNVEHHRAHLASSLFVAPLERAALLSIDGFGDFVSTMSAAG